MKLTEKLRKAANLLKNFVVSGEGTFLNEILRSTFFYSPIVSPLILFSITGFSNSLERWLTGFTIALVVSYTCILISFFIQKVVEPAILKAMGRPTVQHSRSWWLSLSLCAMPAGMYLGFKVNFLIHRLLAPYLNIPMPPDDLGATVDDYRIGLVIGTLIAIAFFLLRTRREAREQQRLNLLRIKDLENQRLAAQLSALTAQMNPHLMFNALNTVAALVPTDPIKAEDTIIQLSELYRGVLNSSRQLTHSLSQELELCSAYLAIEKARFGDRLQTNISIDSSLDPSQAQVPALCLQPLVENAIKHGISPKAAGGEVGISARRDGDRLHIQIIDNGVGFAVAENRAASSPPRSQGSRTALKNCQERLTLHYRNSSDFKISDREGGGSVVELLLPLVQVEVPC
jgi:signal transduction histidine kinase